VFPCMACQIGTFLPQFGLTPNLCLFGCGAAKAKVDMEGFKGMLPPMNSPPSTASNLVRSANGGLQVLAAQHYI